MAGSRYKSWTEEEDRRLLELHDSGRSAFSIAMALKRTKSGVQSRLSFLRADDQDNRR
jgi:hypothetical protein